MSYIIYRARWKEQDGPRIQDEYPVTYHSFQRADCVQRLAKHAGISETQADALVETVPVHGSPDSRQLDELAALSAKALHD